jgi:hypothetical protein
MRVNIHLPDELHRQLKEHADVNVSAICRAALERELRIQVAAARAPAGFGLTAARLARTKAGKAAKDYDEGREIGSDWARSTATWDELSKVAALADRPPMRFALEDGHTLREVLFGWASGEGFDPDPDWFEALTDKPFDQGVVRGAADVFTQVKDIVSEASS